MRPRTLAFLWLAMGVAVWCGFFDLYVSRGARLYLQRQAEYELHPEPPRPSMEAVMARPTHDGLIAASLWSGAIMVAGWGTIWLKRR